MALYAMAKSLALKSLWLWGLLTSLPIRSMQKVSLCYNDKLQGEQEKF